MSKNILILSAGRRVELLKIFKKSLNKNKLVSIFTADSNPKFSPACKINNNTFKLPKCSEKLYIKKLLLMCKKNNINTERRYRLKRNMKIIDFDYIPQYIEERVCQQVNYLQNMINSNYIS